MIPYDVAMSASGKFYVVGANGEIAKNYPELWRKHYGLDTGSARVRRADVDADLKPLRAA